MGISRISFLTPTLWLPLIILLSLVPFVIFAHHEGELNYSLFFSFSAPILSGFVLCSLSYKYNKDREQTQNPNNSIFVLLIIVSTIVAIAAVVYISPQTLSPEHISIAFSISYGIIITSWWYYKRTVAAISSAPDLDQLLTQLESERRYFWKFLLTAEFFLQHKPITEFIDVFSKIRTREIKWHSILEILEVLPKLIWIPSALPIWIILKYAIKNVNELINKNRSNNGILEIEKNEYRKDGDDNTNYNLAKLFQLIFAVVVGLAITKSLEKFSEAIEPPLPVTANFTNLLHGSSWGMIFTVAAPLEVIVLMIFFVVTIPFFHATAVFLTNAKVIYGRNRKPQTILIHYIILLIETIMLFLMAENINVVENDSFAVFLMLMVSADVLWTTAELLIIKNRTVPQEWVYTNFLTVLFLFYFVVFLYSPISGTTSSESEFTLIYLILFFVLLARALINYTIGWKEIYSKDIQAFG